ncbi:MAG TPA: hypothetical protein VF384_15875 [Planctomycetota bacterium]
MFTRLKHNTPRAIALLAAILSYAVAQPVSAQSSTVDDPSGDTFFLAPAFQDIVGARMTKLASGDFELLMEMAGPVPGAPILPPPGVNQIWWNWVFDLDPTASPRGYPVSPGTALYPELIVYVSWNGSQFAGTAVDRRPLLTGGTAVITPVPFVINGTTVEAFLDFTLIGEVPPIFDWRPVTVDWAGPLGSMGFLVPDNTDFVGFGGESIAGELVDPYAFCSTWDTATRGRERESGRRARASSPGNSAACARSRASAACQLSCA